MIDPCQVLMANAAMVHFGLDPGHIIHWLAGEYTGHHRNLHSTLAAIRDLISIEDYQHMKRILLHGCPAKLTFNGPLDKKLEMIKQENSKIFNKNINLVLKTMNKEDRYSHLVPLDETMCHFSPHCRHKTQTMVIKKGKNDRLCWDGSTTMRPTDIVMNQITPLAKEAPIMFGHVKMQMYTDIYNTCVSSPKSIMMLAAADIKACFRFARVHAYTITWLWQWLLDPPLRHRAGNLSAEPSRLSPYCTLIAQILSRSTASILICSH